MKKRALSILFLVAYATLAVLSLASCGGSENVRGVELDCYISDFTYDDENDITTYLEICVTARNANNSSAIKNFRYKLTFLDSNSSVLGTKQLTYSHSIGAGSYENFYQTFSSQQGDGVRGYVERVLITPIEMTLGEGSSDNDGGATEWSFWTYFWVIISGILVLLFVFCCIGAEGDGYAILGGVVIFILPAIIILSIYFGFFFGT